MNLESGIKTLEREKTACLIYQREKEIFRSDAIGVKPLLMFLEQHQKHLPLTDLILVDKVIGKAALLIAVHLGVRRIYTPVASEMAHQTAKIYKVDLGSQKRVPFILNRTKDGMCPIEEAVINIEDTELAIVKIQSTIKELMANKK